MSSWGDPSWELVANRALSRQKKQDHTDTHYLIYYLSVFPFSQRMLKSGGVYQNWPCVKFQILHQMTLWREVDILSRRWDTGRCSSGPVTRWSPARGARTLSTSPLLSSTAWPSTPGTLSWSEIHPRQTLMRYVPYISYSFPIFPTHFLHILLFCFNTDWSFTQVYREAFRCLSILIKHHFLHKHLKRTFVMIFSSSLGWHRRGQGWGALWCSRE